MLNEIKSLIAFYLVIAGIILAACIAFAGGYTWFLYADRLTIGSTITCALFIILGALLAYFFAKPFKKWLYKIMKIPAKNSIKSTNASIKSKR